MKLDDKPINTLAGQLGLTGRPGPVEQKMREYENSFRCFKFISYCL